MKKRILITYFSWSGNTKHIAEEIQACVESDMFEIDKWLAEIKIK